jgi:hypothetical protein
MATVFPLAPLPTAPRNRGVESEARAIRTDTVYVVFTTAAQTLPAIRVAAALGRRLGGSLRLIHCRVVPYPLQVDAPAGVSAIEVDAFVERVKAEGIDLQLRVYLCRNDAQVLPNAFKRHSIVVIGGRRSWWPTAAERLRRRLEAAGHYVVFVDAGEHEERADA